jgi:hypothetical protein
VAMRKPPCPHVHLAAARLNVQTTVFPNKYNYPVTSRVGSSPRVAPNPCLPNATRCTVVIASKINVFQSSAAPCTPSADARRKGEHENQIRRNARPPFRSDAFYLLPTATGRARAHYTR